MPPPTPEVRPVPAAGSAARNRRRRVAEAAAYWMSLTLGGIVLMTGLVLWHLIRRGRQVRENLGPPRDVQLPDLPSPGPDDPERDSPHA